MKYKSTIIIYSDFDPNQTELTDLAREATDGSAICDSMKISPVYDHELPEGVQAFFMMDEDFPKPNHPEDE